MRITCKVILFIPILIVTSISCAPIKKAEAWVRHSSWSADVRSVTSPQEHRGIFAGFVRPEHRDTPIGQRPPITQFAVGGTGVFIPLLILGTGREQPYPVLVSAFLDYEQVSFALDGRDGRLHYLEIPPGTDLEIPMTVPMQSKGWHDFFVVVFGEPENQTVDPNDRLPGSPTLPVGGVRTVICVGECNYSPRAFPAPYEGRPSGERAGSAFLAALPLLPDPTLSPQRRLLQVVHGQPDQPYTLQIWALNETDQPMDYIAMPLLDYQQINIGAGKALPFSMPAGTELFVPGRVAFPREPGVHELQVVYIFNPYEAVDGHLDPFVHCITRAAFVVDQ
jgi:hypothetical protein